MDRREARVTMDRPRFAQGLTFDGYKRQMTRNRERFDENERRVALRPDDFRELGHWIERPASVTDLRAKRRREIFAAHPEFGSPDAPVDQLPEDVRAQLQAELAKMRDETTPFANQEVIRELRELVTRVAA